MSAESKSISCPVPASPRDGRITLADGEGGRLTRRLIRERILPTLANKYLADLGDAASLPRCDGPLAMSTDSFVVSPLFFPGGDIGSLAVHGTVNDLAVSGARPLWISLGLILEEGLPIATLEKVLMSVAAAARRSEVRVVAGDTKVVPRGAADRLFINTTGIGEKVSPSPLGPATLQPGDEILVTGPIGRHGMAVMASREGLEFESPPTSDSAPLIDAVEKLRQAGIPLRAMRDATRGGLAAVLHEWAEASQTTLLIEEELLPVTPEVRGLCEVLGIDAVHVANEGTMVVAVPAGSVGEALDALRSVAETAHATRIGEVCSHSPAAVVVRRALGRLVPLDEPLGAPLPRIC